MSNRQSFFKESSDINTKCLIIIYLLFIKKDETSSEIQLNDLMKILVGDDEEGYLKQIKQMTERQATLVENLEERFDAFSKGLSSIGGQGQLAEINLEILNSTKDYT